MSFLDLLNESRESSAPAYHEFLQRYDPKIKQVFVFYEGDEDSSFYNQFLAKHIPDDYNIEEIIAGCKNNVLKIHREFDWKKYDKEQIIFIVDRDLSFWLNEPEITEKNIFVTDEYSVENYVVTDMAFRSWLFRFQGFARSTKAELNNMVEEFNRLIPKFKQEMIPIMAKAIVAKRKNSAIELKEFRIKTQVEFYYDEGHIEFKIIDYQGVLSKWEITQADNREIELQEKQIRKHYDHYSVRGKWLIVFMAELGEYMRLNSSVFFRH